MFAKSQNELRKFGLVMATAWAVVAALVFWRHGIEQPFRIFVALSATFLILAIVAPRVLAPVDWAWMRLAAVMSYFMTRVILTLTFYLAVLPVGLLMRALGSGMQLRRDPSAKTYWKPVDKEN